MGVMVDGSMKMCVVAMKDAYSVLEVKKGLKTKQDGAEKDNKTVQVQLPCEESLKIWGLVCLEKR